MKKELNVQIQHIKIKDSEGVSEYKITSKKGCCFKDLMPKDVQNLLTHYLLCNQSNKFREQDRKIRELEQKIVDITQIVSHELNIDWINGELERLNMKRIMRDK